MKKITSIVLCAVMLLSGMAIASVHAESYEFYTVVGEEFIPDTTGITWGSVDTSLMGKRIISGKDSSGNTVYGTVNVGAKKWYSFQNNETKLTNKYLEPTPADESVVVQVPTVKDEWTYRNASDYKRGIYRVDTRNSDNMILEFGFQKNVGELVYYTEKSIDSANDFSVQLEAMLASANFYINDTFSFKLFDPSGSVFDALTIAKRSGGVIKLSLNEGSEKETTMTFDKWSDIRLAVDKNREKVALYVDGVKIDEATTNFTTSYAPAYLSASGQAQSTAKRTIYFDNVRFTDLSTTDIIYYDDFDFTEDYSFLKDDPTTSVSIKREVKFVDKNGTDSGFGVPLGFDAAIDTSAIGDYKLERELLGFDEKLAVNYSVYKEGTAWAETFDAYVDTDVSKAPYLAPYISGAGTDKTIEWEDDTKTNKVLKYTRTSDDGTSWLRMGDGKKTSGRVSVSFRFKTPVMHKSTKYNFQILGDYNGSDIALINSILEFNSANLGGVYCQYWDTEQGKKATHYPIALAKPSNIVANTWYKITYNIDTEAETFTYSINDGEQSRPFLLETYGKNCTFTALRLNINNDGGDTTTERTIYVDDMSVKRMLSVKEPLPTSAISVFKGEVAQLPETVKVLLTDEITKEDAAVTWNGSVDTSVSGTKTISGTVAGTSIPVTLTVYVSDYAYEIVRPVIKNNGELILGLKDGAGLSLASLRQISISPKAGKLYAAVYDEGGKLHDVTTASLPTTWTQGEEKDIQIPLSFDFDETVDVDKCELKLFVFPENLSPYALPVEVSNEDTPENVTIYIAGDSTAANKVDAQRPEYGWGELFTTLYQNANVTVSNQAMGSRSSKSFYDEGRLEAILDAAQPGDYLLIQFGHNDANTKIESSYADPNEGGIYEEYLTKYVLESREKGMIPVILTSICVAQYSGNEFIGNTVSALDLSKYSAAAKRVASKYHVPVIDVLELTYQYFSGLESKEETFKHYDYYTEDFSAEGNKDIIHLNETGARKVAQMVKEEMERLLFPMARLWNE